MNKEVTTSQTLDPVHFFEEKIVFHKNRPSGTRGDGVLIVTYGPAIGPGHDRAGLLFGFVCWHRIPKCGDLSSIEWY
jgi:hypothetical protein